MKIGVLCGRYRMRKYSCLLDMMVIIYDWEYLKYFWQIAEIMWLKQ